MPLSVDSERPEADGDTIFCGAALMTRLHRTFRRGPSGADPRGEPFPRRLQSSAQPPNLNTVCRTNATHPLLAKPTRGGGGFGRPRRGPPLPGPCPRAVALLARSDNGRKWPRRKTGGAGLAC